MLADIGKIILTFLLEKVWGLSRDFIKSLFNKHEDKKDKESATAIKEKLEKYEQSGENPDMTPEQKAKEQEDAFRDYINESNRSN